MIDWERVYLVGKLGLGNEFPTEFWVRKRAASVLTVEFTEG